MTIIFIGTLNIIIEKLRLKLIEKIDHQEKELLCIFSIGTSSWNKRGM